MTPASILLIVALVCFVLAAVGMGVRRINLTALGLACWVGAILLGGGGLDLPG